MEDAARIAIHDDDRTIMRDFFIGRRVVGTMFSFLRFEGEIHTTSGPEDRENWQQVGTAACFMS